MAKMKLKGAGSKFYAYGVQIIIPNLDGDPQQITFTGSFDRRQLRKMLRKTLGGSWKVEELDFIIDNFSTKLRRATMEEVIAMAEGGDGE